MKLAIALGLSLLTSAALAKSLPAVPANCAQDIAATGFCSATVAPAFKGPIDISFFVVVDKASYPTVENLIGRYLSFNSWPTFAKSSGTDDLQFTKSVALPSFQKDGVTVFPHYHDYKLKSPIGYQKVRGVTLNSRVANYPGALASVEFAVQNTGSPAVPAGEKPLTGAEGVQYQTGSVHAVACGGVYSFCSADQYLLVYQTNVLPDIDLLPKVAAASIQKGIESLLIGMWFNDAK